MANWHHCRRAGVGRSGRRSREVDGRYLSGRKERKGEEARAIKQGASVHSRVGLGEVESNGGLAAAVAHIAGRVTGCSCRLGRFGRGQNGRLGTECSRLHSWRDSGPTAWSRLVTAAEEDLGVVCIWVGRDMSRPRAWVG